MKSLLLLCIALLLGCTYTFAQTPRPGEIRGKVLDDTGSPLPGASVLLTGSRKGVQTDNAGNFELTVPDGSRHYKLTISFIGFAAQQVEWPFKGPLEIKLVRASNEDEIVIGYQRVQRKDLTGAVSAS
jgi:hypothetical protein